MKKIIIGGGSQSFIDKDSYESLSKYFKEVNKKELISPEEEVELAKRIQKGDKLALDKLVESNLRFVISVAKQYQNQGLTLQELIGEGNVGLIAAAKKFDHTKGFKFISYAVWWIKQSIVMAINENSKVVKLPTNKIELKNKIKKATNLLTNKLDREPTLLEISEEIGEEISTIQNALASNNYQSYLEDPVKNEENDGYLIDIIENENADIADENLMKKSLVDDLNAAFKALTPEESKILKMFFGIGYEFPLSCKDIGKELGYGSERIRQKKDKALRRIKFVSKRNLSQLV